MTNKERKKRIKRIAIEALKDTILAVGVITLGGLIILQLIKQIIEAFK